MNDKVASVLLWLAHSDSSAFAVTLLAAFCLARSFYKSMHDNPNA